MLRNRFSLMQHLAYARQYGSSLFSFAVHAGDIQVLLSSNTTELFNKEKCDNCNLLLHRIAL